MVIPLVLEREERVCRDIITHILYRLEWFELCKYGDASDNLLHRTSSIVNKKMRFRILKNMKKFVSGLHASRVKQQ